MTFYSWVGSTANDLGHCTFNLIPTSALQPSFLLEEPFSNTMCSESRWFHKQELTAKHRVTTFQDTPGMWI